MIRATTPTHTFNIPIEANKIQEILVTYRQVGRNILEKKNSDMTNDGNAWSLTLTQQETKLFMADTKVEVQVRVLTTGGDALASKIFSVTVDRVLNDEVMA